MRVGEKFGKHAFCRPHHVFQRATGRHNEEQRLEACAILKLVLSEEKWGGQQQPTVDPWGTPFCPQIGQGPPRPGLKPRWAGSRI
jgi:hypothetical protein